MRDLYAQKGLAQIPRLLSLEDRNPLSPTYGCSNREYWLCRSTDFPSAIAQFGIHALALAWRYDMPGNIYYQQEKIRQWTVAGIEYWMKIQKRDGSFDEFYPNERGWAGPTGFLLYAMIDSYRLLGEEKIVFTDQLEELERLEVAPAPVGVRHYLHAISHRAAYFRDHLHVILDVIGAYLELEPAVAGFHQLAGLRRHFFRRAGRHHVGQAYLLVGKPAEEFIKGHSQRLAHEVMEGVIDDGLGLVVNLDRFVNPTLGYFKSFRIKIYAADFFSREVVAYQSGHRSVATALGAFGS